MQVQLYGKKIWLYRQSIDFRSSIDGLINMVMMRLKQKPQDAIYIFYNRKQDKIKCLSWHRNGYLLFYKRLEKGRFNFQHDSKGSSMEVSVEELSWLLAGLEWEKMRDWRELNYDKFS
jgi:transposase